MAMSSALEPSEPPSWPPPSSSRELQRQAELQVAAAGQVDRDRVDGEHDAAGLRGGSASAPPPLKTKK